MTKNGFTLVEMVVVIVIISLAALLVFPLLPSTDAANLRSSGRTLAAVFRYLGDRAITTKSPYRMVLNLADSTISVKKIVNGEEVPPEDPFFARKILSDRVTIEDIEIPRLGRLDEGMVSVDFGQTGLGDLVIVHLKGDKDLHYTVTALPGGGRVNLREGYQEMKQ
jgi:general secretion pathway protein H